jgi:FKBP-type peptidyl-prolyl cis-trans isomerase FklB
MFRLFSAALVLLFLGTGCQQNAGSSGSTDTANFTPKTHADSLSYGMGVTMGKSLKPNAEGINLDALMAGLRDGMNDQEIKLNDDEINSAIIGFRKELESKMREENERLAVENEEKSRKFLEENAKRPEVKTTASGLQYEVIKEGNGKKPGPNSVVVTHYRGTLIDGTQFDSSYDRGEPTEFPLNRVIPGWTEGIQLMSEGAKYKFYIPAELAYGKNSPTPKIPPNSVLVFEVELLKVKS